ncbi:MAG: glycosyltransferase [Myxococcales bacterium]|nr:glycosyltransferase [Myxococcales bacterium]
MARPRALFVSKPIAPPWNDSNKNLVRDLARATTRVEPVVMTPRGVDFDGAAQVALYQDLGTYAPSKWANLRVLEHLVAGPRYALWHFFFAPNPPTLHAGRAAAWLRKTPTVHTLASAPDRLEAVAPSLFANQVVVLSEHTRRRLARVGVESTVIAPCLGPVSVDPEAVAAARRRYDLPARFALYAGDLEHSNGAETFVKAAALAPSVGWVIAARPKTARAHEALAALKALAEHTGAKVTFLGALDDILAVVKAASVNTLVVDTLNAKMDYPLVLLEAMALGVPVMVGAGTAAEDLVAGGAEALAPGDAEALAARVLARVDTPSDDYAEGARAWLAATCSPAAVAAAYARVYEAALAGSPRPRGLW